jgi:hypothetical protein
MRRWLERQARQSFDQGAMPNYPTKDSASSPEALVSNDIAPNGSTTEGNDEMNKNESATGNAAVRRQSERMNCGIRESRMDAI